LTCARIHVAKEKFGSRFLACARIHVAKEKFGSRFLTCARIPVAKEKIGSRFLTCVRIPVVKKKIGGRFLTCARIPVVKEKTGSRFLTCERIHDTWRGGRAWILQSEQMSLVMERLWVHLLHHGLALEHLGVQGRPHPESSDRATICVVVVLGGEECEGWA
jgi:hypothetical protein